MTKTGPRIRGNSRKAKPCCCLEDTGRKAAREQNRGEAERTAAPHSGARSHPRWGSRGPGHRAAPTASREEREDGERAESRETGL